MTAPFLAPDRDNTFRAGRPRTTATNLYTIPGVAHGAASTFAFSAGTDYYAPIYVYAPIVADQIVAHVWTLSAGSFRVGLYRADTDWQPVGAPLADSGSLDAGTTGLKTYAPASALYLARGRYLTVFNSSSTPTMTIAIGIPPQANSISSLGSMNRLWRTTRAYAAFPTPGTAWDTVTESSSAMIYPVYLRVSAP